MPDAANTFSCVNDTQDDVDNWINVTVMWFSGLHRLLWQSGVFTHREMWQSEIQPSKEWKENNKIVLLSICVYQASDSQYKLYPPHWLKTQYMVMYPRITWQVSQWTCSVMYVSNHTLFAFGNPSSVNIHTCILKNKLNHTQGVNSVEMCVHYVLITSSTDISIFWLR